MHANRTKAIEAYHVLNFLVGDLVAATQVLNVFQTPYMTTKLSNSAAGCLNRMCLSYLFLTLTKWVEFYNHFNQVIPDDCRTECKNLKKEIDRRKIRGFRNTVVGHILDKKKRNVLEQNEVERIFQKIVDDDTDAFVRWCNNSSNNQFPITVVSIVERVKERIREQYGLTKQDIFGEKNAT